MAAMATKPTNAVKWIRGARMLASFALLGAVLVGVVTGHHDMTSTDPRIFGAGAGLVLALIAKFAHVI